MQVSILSLALAVFAKLCLASNGPNWGSGPVSTALNQYNSNGTMIQDPNAANENYIVYGEATITLPNAPNPIVGNTVLWLGMGTYDLPYGHLIQGIANNYPSTNDPSDVCGDLGNRWCIAAFILGHDYNPTGQKVIANPGDQVTSLYQIIEGTTNWNVSMLVNDKLVSNVVSEAGYANGYGFANECTTQPCGYLEAHDWSNCKLILRQPDPNYYLTHGPAGYNAPGVTGEITSADGGVTWTAANIHVPAYTFTTT